jgi:hypothetical protein
MKLNNLKIQILIKYFFYFLLIVILFYACTNSYNNNSLNFYKLISLDTSSFKKVNLFTFLNQNNDKYYVISEKNDFNYLQEKFIINRKYPLYLLKSDSIVIAKLNLFPTRQETIIIDDGKPIWVNDTFVVDIYKSKNINNVYYIK